MKKIAIIPCYDEDTNRLERIVKTTNGFVDKVLVIDDGNKPRIDVPNCVTLRNKKRKGKGYSLRKGFRYALKNKFDIIITLDGDGEHDPVDIVELEKAIKKNEIVLGQRTAYRSKTRGALNLWSTIWVRLLAPDIKDVGCGFRAIRSDLLKKMHLTSKEFEIEIEMVLEAIKNKAKIGLLRIQTNINNKSNIQFQDYIRINNLFDKWIFKNKNYINSSPFKRGILVTSAFIGLNIGRLILWILQKR